MKRKRTLFKVRAYKLYLLSALLYIAGIASLPFILFSGSAAAYGQITNRSLTLSSGVPGNTNTTYTFSFTIPSTSMVQSMKFIACTSAVNTYPGNTGSCTAPTGMDLTTTTFGSQSGWQGATNFAVDGTGANDCTPGANVLCVNRTDTTAQTATARTIVFNTIKNPTSTNVSFYIGIHTYSDASYTAANRVDFGATASAVVQTLTTNAAVAEVLNFCIGSTPVDDADTTLIATDCAGGQGTAVTGTSVNLGTLDTSTINVSPVTINGGDSNNGVAMVRSNAGNGTAIYYDAIQQTGTNHRGTLRISGATCNAVTNTFTDPCINAAGGTQNTFTAGTEEFGMTVAGVNHLGTTSYSCTYDGGGTNPNTCHLEPATNYLGRGSTGLEQYGSANGFAWDETGASTLIASSGSSTVKQIDDEALVLKFAATPSITTPFGPYAAQTDFIAVPNY